MGLEILDIILSTYCKHEYTSPFKMNEQELWPKLYWKVVALSYKRFHHEWFNLDCCINVSYAFQSRQFYELPLHHLTPQKSFFIKINFISCWKARKSPTHTNTGTVQVDAIHRPFVYYPIGYIVSLSRCFIIQLHTCLLGVLIFTSYYDCLSIYSIYFSFWN